MGCMISMPSENASDKITIRTGARAPHPEMRRAVKKSTREYGLDKYYRLVLKTEAFGGVT